MEKSKLLDRAGISGEDRVLLANVLDRAGRALARGVPLHTDFLTPAQLASARVLLRLSGLPEPAYAVLGGYGGAERNILFFLPDWVDPSEVEAYSPIRCLRAVFREEDRLDHRDLLGSLMGLGIVREKIGDILVSPGSADLMVLDSVETFLLQNWSTAGRAKLTVRALDAQDAQVPEASFREVRETVSSLRLDAVASGAFRLSRGKTADLIRGGHVQVNWLPCTKPDHILSEGDTVSARGFGRFVLSQVGGLTRKGRISLTLRL